MVQNGTRKALIQQAVIQQALAQQGLGTDFNHTVERWYQPLAQQIAAFASHHDGGFVVGVQGCQGSGKSTLAVFLKILLEEIHQLRTATVSLDDFYLTRAERQQLAKTVHPLLQTRGVPGTHDLLLAETTFSALRNPAKDIGIALPGFDKALDDRAPETNWSRVSTPIDVVIFEGWCVGVEAQADENLVEPINDLEKIEDPHSIWRSYVNNQLKGPYASLFARLDKLVVLNAPSFDCVYAWRSLQEQKLAEKLRAEKRNDLRVQSPEELQRFISHYERLTRHCLHSLPAKADWLLPLNTEHQITDLICR